MVVEKPPDIRYRRKRETRLRVRQISQSPGLRTRTHKNNTSRYVMVAYYIFLARLNVEKGGKKERV